MSSFASELLQGGLPTISDDAVMDEMNGDARGVCRTLSVLTALNRNNGATVTQLGRATDISRPALYRILGALRACGFVTRREGDSRYFLARSVLDLSSGYDSGCWYAEVARPAISALQRKIGWPTDFATFDRGDMQIAQTTRAQSPYVIDEGKLGRRVSMARTSLGQAFLAFQNPDSRHAHLAQLAAHLEVGELERLLQMLEVIQSRGFATRFRTSDRNPNAIRTGSIAVPILFGGVSIAAIGFTFIAQALSMDAAVDLHLDDLNAAKVRIEGIIAEAEGREVSPGLTAFQPV